MIKDDKTQISILNECIIKNNFLITTRLSKLSLHDNLSF